MRSYHPKEIKLLNPQDKDKAPKPILNSKVKANTLKVKKPLISVCIPLDDNIPAKFFINFHAFLNYSQEIYRIHVVPNVIKPIDRSRNMLVKAAMEVNPDYILFMDADNTIPKDSLKYLIDTMHKTNADLVSGLYFSKYPPYLPVLREYKYDGYWQIFNVNIGTVFEIDGAGMGLALIKPNVFRALEEPYFAFSYEKHGYKEIQLAEDLYFCRKMKRANMKLFCDARVTMGHIGAEITQIDFMTYAPGMRKTTEADREEAILDYVKFSGISQKEVELRIMVGDERMKDEWNIKKPQTDDEIKRFYKETENYFYDLAKFHFETNRMNDLEIVSRLFYEVKPKNVLEYGAGIGQVSNMLAKEGIDVTIADLGSKTLDFAEFRMKEHKLPYKIWKVDETEDAPDENYDVILLIEVLEHLPLEELKKTVDKLLGLCHKETIILATSSFGKSKSHPMHYELLPEHAKEIARLSDFNKKVQAKK